jgi:thioredoxin 2
MGYSILRTCPSCGASNRVPIEHLADTGRCGACKAALSPLGSPFEANATDFNAIVGGARVPVFVDFWAAWCGPCKMAAPVVAALAREVAGRAVVLKVDTDGNPDIAERYGIQSIPTFVVFRSGQPVFRRSGVAPQSEMRSWIEQSLPHGRGSETTRGPVLQSRTSGRSRS